MELAAQAIALALCAASFAICENPDAGGEPLWQALFAAIVTELLTKAAKEQSRRGKRPRGEPDMTDCLRVVAKAANSICRGRVGLQVSSEFHPECTLLAVVRLGADESLAAVGTAKTRPRPWRPESSNDALDATQTVLWTIAENHRVPVVVRAIDEAQCTRLYVYLDDEIASRYPPLEDFLGFAQTQGPLGCVSCMGVLRPLATDTDGWITQDGQQPVRIVAFDMAYTDAGSGQLKMVKTYSAVRRGQEAARFASHHNTEVGNHEGEVLRAGWNGYETVIPDTPYHLMIDIDKRLEGEPRRGDHGLQLWATEDAAVLEACTKSLRSFLISIGETGRANSLDCGVCSASNASKLSLHIEYNSIAFTDIYSQGAFVRDWCRYTRHEMHENEELWRPLLDLEKTENAGAPVLVIDESIYQEYRLLRCPFQTKLKPGAPDRPLWPVDPTTCVRLHASVPESIAAIQQATNTMRWECTDADRAGVWDYRALEDAEGQRRRGSAPRQRRAAREGARAAPSIRLSPSQLHFARELAQNTLTDSTIDVSGGGYINQSQVTVYTSSRLCPHAQNGREHNSNTAILVIRRNGDVWRQCGCGKVPRPDAVLATLDAAQLAQFYDEERLVEAGDDAAPDVHMSDADPACLQLVCEHIRSSSRHLSTYPGVHTTEFAPRYHSLADSIHVPLGRVRQDNEGNMVLGAHQEQVKQFWLTLFITRRKYEVTCRYESGHVETIEKRKEFCCKRNTELCHALNTHLAQSSHVGAPPLHGAAVVRQFNRRGGSSRVAAGDAWTVRPLEIARGEAGTAAAAQQLQFQPMHLHALSGGTGVGKSQVIKACLRAYSAQHRAQSGREPRMLVLSPLIAIGTTLAELLDCTFYRVEDRREDETNAQFLQRRQQHRQDLPCADRVVCSLESLHLLVNLRPFDVIVWDECELGLDRVLNHQLRDRYVMWRRLTSLFGACDCVIVADAYLKVYSMHTLHDMMSRGRILAAPQQSADGAALAPVRQIGVEVTLLHMPPSVDPRRATVVETPLLADFRGEFERQVSHNAACIAAGNTASIIPSALSFGAKKVLIEFHDKAKVLYEEQGVVMRTLTLQDIERHASGEAVIHNGVVNGNEVLVLLLTADTRKTDAQLFTKVTENTQHWGKLVHLFYSPVIPASLSFTDRHFRVVFALHGFGWQTAEECVQADRRVRDLSTSDPNPQLWIPYDEGTGVIFLHIKYGGGTQRQTESLADLQRNEEARFEGALVAEGAQAGRALARTGCGGRLTQIRDTYATGSSLHLLCLTASRTAERNAAYNAMPSELKELLHQEGYCIRPFMTDYAQQTRSRSEPPPAAADDDAMVHQDSVDASLRWACVRFPSLIQEVDGNTGAHAGVHAAIAVAFWSHLAEAMGLPSAWPRAAFEVSLGDVLARCNTTAGRLAWRRLSGVATPVDIQSVEDAMVPVSDVADKLCAQLESYLHMFGLTVTRKAQQAVKRPRVSYKSPFRSHEQASVVVRYPTLIVQPPSFKPNLVAFEDGGEHSVVTTVVAKIRSMLPSAAQIAVHWDDQQMGFAAVIVAGVCVRDEETWCEWLETTLRPVLNDSEWGSIAPGATVVAAQRTLFVAQEGQVPLLRASWQPDLEMTDPCLVELHRDDPTRYRSQRVNVFSTSPTDAVL